MADHTRAREEYLSARQIHIVDIIYSGNDNLPLETKEQLLMDSFGPNVQFGSVHCTRLDAHGKNIGDGHVRFTMRVNSLEHIYLCEIGAITQ